MRRPRRWVQVAVAPALPIGSRDALDQAPPRLPSDCRPSCSCPAGWLSGGIHRGRRRRRSRSPTKHDGGYAHTRSGFGEFITESRNRYRGGPQGLPGRRCREDGLLRGVQVTERQHPVRFGVRGRHRLGVLLRHWTFLAGASLRRLKRGRDLALDGREQAARPQVWRAERPERPRSIRAGPALRTLDSGDCHHVHVRRSRHGMWQWSARIPGQSRSLSPVLTSTASTRGHAARYPLRRQQALPTSARPPHRRSRAQDDLGAGSATQPSCSDACHCSRHAREALA
jgi:hypothetical protein